MSADTRPAYTDPTCKWCPALVTPGDLGLCPPCAANLAAMAVDRPRSAAALPDETIRAVIEAWERAGSVTECDGEISPRVCDLVRAQIKAVRS